MGILPNVHNTTSFNHQQFIQSINFYFAKYDIVIIIIFPCTVKQYIKGTYHYII